MALTFQGGVNVDEHKSARKNPIEIFPAPKFVYIPLSQHIGIHAKSLVKTGDIVDKGQMIANNEKGLSCPVHSSVSGKVVSIERRMLQTGVQTEYIVIENDFADRLHISVKPFGKKISDTSPHEIIEVIERAGISGLGGAMFPTYAKIESAINKVTTLIVNCVECEPYITADHRLVLERPESVVNGMKILLKALGLKIGYIAIADNKLNAADAITDISSKSKMVEIKILKTKYPQGDERQLIYALTGKEIPSGKLPVDYGCIVFNAETCAAVYNAFVLGLPLIDRIVTVDGDCIMHPKNLRVPIGTPASAIIEYCGLRKEPKKIIKGGPMMGLAAFDINTPVTKGTSGILAFSEKHTHKVSSQCIRCGKCVNGCSMRLMPSYLAMFAQRDEFEMCEKYDIFNCVECGSCTYICPAGVPIVQYIRTAKGRIQEKHRKETAIANAKQSDAPMPSEKYQGRSAAARRNTKIMDNDDDAVEDRIAEKYNKRK